MWSVLGQDTEPLIAPNSCSIGVWLSVWVPDKQVRPLERSHLPLLCECVGERANVDLYCKALWVVKRGEKHYVVYLPFEILEISVNKKSIFVKRGTQSSRVLIMTLLLYNRGRRIILQKSTSSLICHLIYWKARSSIFSSLFVSFCCFF